MAIPEPAHIERFSFHGTASQWQGFLQEVNLPIELKVENVTCPILHDWTFDPVSVFHKGLLQHRQVFDRRAIEEWMHRNQNTCPICQKTILSIERDESASQLVDSLVKKRALFRGLHPFTANQLHEARVAIEREKKGNCIGNGVYYCCLTTLAIPLPAVVGYCTVAGASFSLCEAIAAGSLGCTTGLCLEGGLYMLAEEPFQAARLKSQQFGRFVASRMIK